MVVPVSWFTVELAGEYYTMLSTISLGSLLHAEAFYSKSPGMEFEKLAQVSTMHMHDMHIRSLQKLHC